MLGLSAEESETLLAMLYRHIGNPRFMCRFRWQANSVAFWDNRCTQHQAIFDYFPARRSGLRVTINGSTPAGCRTGQRLPQHEQELVVARWLPSRNPYRNGDKT